MTVKLKEQLFNSIKGQFSESYVCNSPIEFPFEQFDFLTKDLVGEKILKLEIKP